MSRVQGKSSRSARACSLRLTFERHTQDALTRDNIDSDHELLYVARYLLQLTKVPDVTQLDHSKFRKSKLALPDGVEDPLRRFKRA